MARTTTSQFIIKTVSATAVASLAILAVSPTLSHAAIRPQGSSTTSTSATAPGQPKFGDAGAAVLALQKAIVANGFTLVGGVTGKFSTQTLRALKNFQRVVGLPVSGVVDVRTATVLKLIAAPKSSKGTTNGSKTQAKAKMISLTVVPARGMSGRDVKLLQFALVAAGVSLKGGIDGVFGQSTANALAAFQKSKSLASTGVLDSKTAAALKISLPSKGSKTQPVSSAKKPLTIETLPVFGQKSSQVRILQNALVKAGIQLKGGVDGVFGVATRVALRKYQTAKGLAVTGELNLATALKLNLVDKPKIMLDVFPVQGICSYADTWHDPRSGGRLHVGVDIIADQGKLLYAVANGTITKVYVDAPGKPTGHGVRLTKADGTYFFYGHMSKLADGITVGTVVKAGQVIGYVGHTGNTTTNHLHFEVHPFGGEAVNPYPIVKAVDACKVTAPYGTTAA